MNMQDKSVWICFPFLLTVFFVFIYRILNITFLTCVWTFGNKIPRDRVSFLTGILNSEEQEQLDPQKFPLVEVQTEQTLEKITLLFVRPKVFVLCSLGTALCRQLADL